MLKWPKKALSGPFSPPPGHPQRNAPHERTSLAGQAAGIKEVGDGIWLVSFIDYDLGYIDLEEKTLQPLENPFWPRSAHGLQSAKIRRPGPCVSLCNRRPSSHQSLKRQRVQLADSRIAEAELRQDRCRELRGFLVHANSEHGSALGNRTVEQSFCGRHGHQRVPPEPRAGEPRRDQANRRRQSSLDRRACASCANL